MCECMVLCDRLISDPGCIPTSSSRPTTTLDKTLTENLNKGLFKRRKICISYFICNQTVRLALAPLLEMKCARKFYSSQTIPLTVKRVRIHHGEESVLGRFNCAVPDWKLQLSMREGNQDRFLTGLFKVNKKCFKSMSPL